MFCTQCGTRGDDAAQSCDNCGAALPRAGQLPAVTLPNYLVQAILVTVCCCLPLGIPALVFAAQVNGKVAAGDAPGALAASKKAKMWCWIAFGSGLLLSIVWVFFALAGMVVQVP